VQPDGKILVAGSCSNGNDVDLCIARYSANGVLDATFGNGGKVLTFVSDYGDNAYAIAVQPDGKIVVAAPASSSSPTRALPATAPMACSTPRSALTVSPRPSSPSTVTSPMPSPFSLTASS
jgi:uncharacterized delta-60 repeat protein